MRRLFFAVLAVLVLPACNTMYNKTYQKISVHTPGVENVRCILETDVNKYVALTPSTVTIDRSTDPLRVTCEKANYLTNLTIVESKIRMVPSQLNVFNGIVPGLTYDMVSHSVYAYPETLVITMLPDPKANELPPREIHVLPLRKIAVKPHDVIVAKAKAAGNEVEGKDDEEMMSELLDDQDVDAEFSQTARK